MNVFEAFPEAIERDRWKFVAWYRSVSDDYVFGGIADFLNREPFCDVIRDYAIGADWISDPTEENGNFLFYIRASTIDGLPPIEAQGHKHRLPGKEEQPPWPKNVLSQIVTEYVIYDAKAPIQGDFWGGNTRIEFNHGDRRFYRIKEIAEGRNQETGELEHYELTLYPPVAIAGSTAVVRQQ